MRLKIQGLNNRKDNLGLTRWPSASESKSFEETGLKNGGTSTPESFSGIAQLFERNIVNRSHCG